MDKSIGIYLRVSTDDQARNGYGLGDQEMQCRKYLELYYPDADNVIIYKDDGFSGKNLERPQMQKLLKDVEKGKIKSIIVFKLDRLTRSVVDTYNLISKITSYNCSLVAVVDKLDISSANGRMLVGMLSIISQWEREVISERTIAGMREMARQGKYPFSKSKFGWDKNEEKILSVNQKEANCIQFMAARFLEGYSFSEIGRMIKKKYNYSFNITTIRRYLLRKCNIGLLDYGGIVYSHIFPPILKREIYDEILKEMKYRERHTISKYGYIFHSLVYCKCGERLHQSCTIKNKNNHRKTFYYYCCPVCNKRINQSEILKQIKIAVILEKERKMMQEIRKRNNKEIKVLESKISQIINHFIGDDDLKESSLVIINQLKKKIKKLEKEQDLPILRNNIHSFEKMDEKMKYHFMHNIIKKIIVNIETKEVTSILYKDYLNKL